MRVQLLALLAAAGVCHAADPEQWMVAHAPHFAVYSNSDAESTRSLAAGFERLHDLFARQLGVAPNAGPIRVIAFATVEEFARYRSKRTTDAFYVGATAGDYIVMPAGTPGNLRVPAHEYAHLLLHSTGWKLPPWIGEGISEVAGTVKIGERGATVGGEITGRAQLLRTQRWLPMTELFRSRESEDGPYYAQCWLLADLLLFSPKYAPGFPAFLATLSTGTSSENALMSVYRVTPDEFAADARSRLSRANPATPIAALLISAAAIRTEATNGAALLAGLRGTQAFDHNDRATALAEWKKAIDLGTDDAGLCYRYAVLADDRAALERTLALDPAFDDARYKLALLEKSEGHLQSAVAHLRKMNAPTGERAFGYWIALGDAQLDLGRRADARESFAQASAAATTDAQRTRAAELDWMARTELAVEFDGKQAHTIRVPVDGPARNPFIESGDRAKSAEATLEHVECGDDGIKVKLVAAGSPLLLAVPDPSRVQIRNAGGIEFEFTCGPQQSRKVLVEYTTSGVLRGLELR
jgi:tetratricopeptide (TPR) repeat protein